MCAQGVLFIPRCNLSETMKVIKERGPTLIVLRVLSPLAELISSVARDVCLDQTDPLLKK